MVSHSSIQIKPKDSIDMKLSTPVQLDRSDFPEAPSWISKLLYPLQLFITQVTSILTNQITLQDNVSCVIKQITLQAGVADTNNIVSFPWNLPRQPIELSLHVTRQDGTYEVVYPEVSWNYINTSIVVNGIKGLTSGKFYSLNFVVK